MEIFFFFAFVFSLNLSLIFRASRDLFLSWVFSQGGCLPPPLSPISGEQMEPHQVAPNRKAGVSYRLFLGQVLVNEKRSRLCVRWDASGLIECSWDGDGVGSLGSILGWKFSVRVIGIEFSEKGRDAVCKNVRQDAKFLMRWFQSVVESFGKKSNWVVEYM